MEEAEKLGRALRAAEVRLGVLQSMRDVARQSVARLRLEAHYHGVDLTCVGCVGCVRYCLWQSVPPSHSHPRSVDDLVRIRQSSGAVTAPSAALPECVYRSLP